MTTRAVEKVQVTISREEQVRTYRDVQRSIDVAKGGARWTAPELSVLARKILKAMGADDSPKWKWELVPVQERYRVAVHVGDQVAISEPLELDETAISSEPATWADDSNYGTIRE
jgi:hypothetical protein